MSKAQSRTHLQTMTKLVSEFPEGEFPKYFKKHLESYIRQMGKDPTSLRLVDLRQKIISFIHSRGRTGTQKGGRAIQHAGNHDDADSDASDLLPDLEKFLGDEH